MVSFHLEIGMFKLLILANILILLLNIFKKFMCKTIRL
jgi:hypothetical protein